MKKAPLMMLITLLCCLTSGPVLAGEEHTKAFEQLKSLVGTWKKAASDNSDFYISYELTANDSVLIETWVNKNRKHSLTLYHLNDKDLMATHYCPQGNQPRLHLSDSSTTSVLQFEYLDATNLATLDHSHQHSLGYEFFDNKDRITRKESYLSKAGEDFSELNLIRLQ